MGPARPLPGQLPLPLPLPGGWVLLIHPPAPFPGPAPSFDPPADRSAGLTQLPLPETDACSTASPATWTASSPRRTAP
jgi:hypothetical protein